jgi:hypothetical protein
MIGLPQFFRVAERGRAAEGAQILGSVRSAQLRYYAEHSVYAGTLDDLDISFTDLKYFEDLTAIANTSGQLGSIESINGNYTMYIYYNGTLSCSGSGCPAGY